MENNFYIDSELGLEFVTLNGEPFTGTLYFRNTVYPNSGYSNGGRTSFTETPEEQDSSEFLNEHSASDNMPDGEICHVRVIDGFFVF